MVLTRGRSEDYVQLAGGRRIYIGTFLAMGLTIPGVSEFMVRQDESGEVTIHLVVDPHAGLGFDEVADNIRTMMNDHLGFDIGLRVVPIDKVTISPGGKARLIESRFQAAAAARLVVPDVLKPTFTTRPNRRRPRSGANSSRPPRCWRSGGGRWSTHPRVVRPARASAQ